MVEFDTSKIGYSLKLDGKYYNTLDIEGFSHMMKDPSYCYKFYWLEAIVQLIAEGVKETTFDAVIDEMICNAWYSVREFSHPSERNANRWTSKRWIGEICK